jgi:putative ABC transport system permease protein
LSGVFGLFALVALALGIVGIYGVMAFAVASRTREIGIRMALGADGPRVSRMVLRDAAGPVAAGVVLGIAGSVAAGRYLGSVLYDIKATDPATYAMVAMLLAAVAFGASLIPAKRASRVDPAVVLRAE